MSALLLFVSFPLLTFIINFFYTFFLLSTKNTKYEWYAGMTADYKITYNDLIHDKLTLDKKYVLSFSSDKLTFFFSLR